MMATTTKRKRIVLSIEDKVTIINRLEKGEVASSLARIYNVGKTTISEIKMRKIEILNFASKLDNIDKFKIRKTMKKANYEKLEDALFSWYLEKRSQGEHITRPIFCEKALELNEKLGGSSEFKASKGWLKNFKSRHGIKDNKIGQTLLCEVPEPESFLKMEMVENDVTDSQNLKEEIEFVAICKDEKPDDDMQDEFDNQAYEESLSEPTHEDAFVAFETALAWCERQSECSSTDILILKRLKDIADMKRQS